MRLFFETRLRALTYHSIILKLITAITAASFLETAFSAYAFNTAEYFQNFAVLRYTAEAGIIFLVLLFTVDAAFDGYILLPLLTGLFIVTNSMEQGIYYALITSIVIGGFIFFLAENMRFPAIGKKTAAVLCAVFALLLALFVGTLTILKFLGHRTSTYDFGIFSQMYHYMSETLIPYTTCERDMLLSHFAVHFSPILYIALPFYMIFPNPSTILAVQAAAVASAVIPLYKLAKHFGLSSGKTVAVVLIYVLHPAVIANNFYYFHENCFLTVLLLWMFYFAEKKKAIPMYVFAFLTMMVKEDAPVYVLFFGLYLLFSNKSKRHGGALCALSCAYFAVVTTLMSMYGQGIMAYRYDNFIFESDGSLYSVVLNIIKNPAFLFTQILSAEKLTFLILILVPMAFLPFAMKKPSAIILLLPMVLINLMTDYQYQYNINYQYTYGSVAFLFYLTVMNLHTLRRDYAKKLLLCGACASLLFFASVNFGRTSGIKQYINERPITETINAALATIPEDKSICADTFLVPALWEREHLYSYKYSDEQADCYVFDLRWDSINFTEFREENPEYELVLFKNRIIAVFQRK